MPSNKWDIERLSAGERSALKRCAGTMLGTNVQATQAFYHALNVKCSQSTESIWYAAMCLQCLWRLEDHPSVKPFAEILRGMYQAPDATESLRHRCTAYLDQSWSEDGFLLGKISNLTRLMRARNASVIPDFEALADDLYHWNHPDHYVQRNWLRTICMQNTTDNKEETENVD